jgi:P4 family phage/plasmid primase-like protien
MSQGLAYRAALQFLASSVPGNTTPETVRWRGHYYQYDGTRYRPVTDETVEAAVTRWLARNPAACVEDGGKVRAITKTLIRDVTLAVRSEATISDALLPGTWIENRPAGAVGPFLATPGGILDLGQLDEGGAHLWPNDPNFFTMASLPVTPDPDAGCSHWLHFLAETFPAGPDAVRLLQETFGYCLWPGCDYETFFMFFGGGGTGKSTTAVTLQALLGEDNVSALSLERFGERFALAGLVGKTANVVFDASDIDKVAEGTLKALASGETVTVEQKHSPVTTMRLTAKHVFITNVLPRFHDTTDGLWRRLVLLPYDRVCPVEQRDHTLKNQLRAELPGIAHWALQGLARLRQQGHFTAYQRGERLTGEYRVESNAVAVFLAGEVEADAEGRVGRQELYHRYREWAQASGHTPMSSTKFYREVRAVFPQPEDEARDGRGGDRLFVGLRLRDRPDVVQQFHLLCEAPAEGA